MDFDDLLLKTEELFAKFPEARFAEASRFDHVLVDEYQDTNDLQYRILKSFADRHRNLCVVGDDDQSIYGWRGAEIAHILGFQRDWPEAKIIRLEENYRSVEPILKLANTLIAHNESRHPKTLRATREGGFDPRFLRFEDEVAESEGIVREVEQRIRPTEPGGPRVVPSDIAILFRTNEQPRAFELELRRAGIPYRLIGGLSFYDRREVRDTLAFLRVLANPNDEVSLLRVINLPPRGIGAGSVEVLVKVAVERGLPLWAVLPEAPQNGDLPHGVGDRIEGFRRLIESYRARLGQEPLFQIATELIAAVDYRSEVRRIYKETTEAEARWNSVEAFLNSIALYTQRNEDASLIGFLEETALAGRENEKDDDRHPHAITLMTLHSAKGLEFPHVYLVGMEEGLLPHARSIVEGRGIDEERRLCYVGVTRAQTMLTLSFAKGRVKWGKARPSIPSRFLMEMRGDTERARRAAAAAEALFGRGELAGDGDDDAAESASKGKKTKQGKKSKQGKKVARCNASLVRPTGGGQARSAEPVGSAGAGSVVQSAELGVEARVELSFGRALAGRHRRVRERLSAPAPEHHEARDAHAAHAEREQRGERLQRTARRDGQDALTVAIHERCLNGVRTLPARSRLRISRRRSFGDFGAVNVDRLSPAAGRHDAPFECRGPRHVALQLLGVLCGVVGRGFRIGRGERERARHHEGERDERGSDDAQTRHASEHSTRTQFA